MPEKSTRYPLTSARIMAPPIITSMLSSSVASQLRKHVFDPEFRVDAALALQANLPMAWIR
jgi:hypothetical protein